MENKIQKDWAWSYLIADLLAWAIVISMIATIVVLMSGCISLSYGQFQPCVYPKCSGW